MGAPSSAPTHNITAAIWAQCAAGQGFTTVFLCAVVPTRACLLPCSVRSRTHLSRPRAAPMQNKASVLVLADHPLLGALLGLWIEMAGARPVFPAPGQLPAATLQEVAPAILLVDVEHPALSSDAMHDAAATAQIPIVLVGPGRLRDSLLHAAAHRGARAFIIPEERTMLADVIASMASERIAPR
jgi:hypothetical protein